MDNQDQPSPSGALHELLEQWARNLRLDLCSARPAIVTAYQPATQLATVIVGDLPVLYLAGEEVVQPPIVIPDVPVAWPGAGVSYVTTPLPPGSTGLIHITDRALAVWMQRGEPADPINGRCHNLADAVFVPGLRPTTGAISVPTSTVSTVVEGPIVALGRAAVSPAVLGTELQTALVTYSAAQTTAANALNVLAEAWLGVPGPTQVAFAEGFAVWATAQNNAQIALVAALIGALSTKVLIE